MARKRTSHAVRHDARAFEPALARSVDALAAQMMRPVGGTPAELRRRMAGELARWRPIIEAANIRLN